MFDRTTAKARNLEKIVFVGWCGSAETLQQGARPSITGSGDQRYPGHIRDLGNEDRTTHEPHCGGRFGLLRGRLNRSAGRLRSGKEVMDDQPEVFALFIKPSRGLGNAKLVEKLRPIILTGCLDNLAVRKPELGCTAHVNPLPCGLQPVALPGVRPPGRPHDSDDVTAYGYLICRHH